jgi:hypothetical protein
VKQLLTRPFFFRVSEFSPVNFCLMLPIIKFQLFIIGLLCLARKLEKRAATVRSSLFIKEQGKPLKTTNND